MEFLYLVIGVILGGLSSLLFSIGYKKRTLYLQAKKKKERQLLLEGDRVYEWLIEYYRRSGNLDDLFDCKIGNFEIKIPFLTKEEWQYFEVIDPKNNGIVQYAETTNQRFQINEKSIKSRVELGQRLFNEPTLYLDRLEESNESVTLHVKGCQYFQIITSLIDLEEETFRAIKNNTYVDVPARDSYFSSVIHAQKLARKPFSVGCVVVAAFKREDTYEIIMQTRSHSTVTFGGTKSGIPNFGLSPILGAQDNPNILLYNFIREYCEELFSYDELIELMNKKRVDPYWFYQLPEARELLLLLEDRKLLLEFLGFGFDGLNGTAIIALLAIIDDVEYSKRLKANLVANWEVAERTLEVIPIEFIDYKSLQLESWLRENRYHFGSAFAISRAIRRLESIQDETS